MVITTLFYSHQPYSVITIIFFLTNYLFPFFFVGDKYFGSNKEGFLTFKRNKMAICPIVIKLGVQRMDYILIFFTHLISYLVSFTVQLLKSFWTCLVSLQISGVTMTVKSRVNVGEKTNRQSVSTFSSTCISHQAH